MRLKTEASEAQALLKISLARFRKILRLSGQSVSRNSRMHQPAREVRNRPVGHSRWDAGGECFAPFQKIV